MSSPLIVSDHPPQAVLDSGCTSSLVTASTPCHNKTPTAHGLRVGIPNGDIMQGSHTGTLNLDHLPVRLDASARAVSVQPDLRKSLLSAGQLCDNGCDFVLLDKKYASIIRNGITTVIGSRDPTTGLWLVDLAPTSVSTPSLPIRHPEYVHFANSAYSPQSKVDLITFLHRACFSPSVSTWVNAIDKGFFTTWPGLTADAVRRHLPKSVHTAKGHLKAAPKNLRSTTKKGAILDSDNTDTPSVVLEPPVRCHAVYHKVVEITGQIYSDQTGRFPVTSSRGNKYIMIVYDHDSSAILAEPISNRSEAELVCAYSHLHQHLTDRGLKPQLQRLDNECPPGF